MEINLDFYKSNSQNKITEEESLIINKYFKENLTDSAEKMLDLSSSFSEVEALSNKYSFFLFN